MRSHSAASLLRTMAVLLPLALGCSEANAPTPAAPYPKRQGTPDQGREVVRHTVRHTNLGVNTYYLTPCPSGKRAVDGGFVDGEQLGSSGEASSDERAWMVNYRGGPATFNLWVLCTPS